MSNKLHEEVGPKKTRLSTNSVVRPQSQPYSTADPLPDISRKLRTFRSQSGKSHYRLEQDTGITGPYLWRLENGKRRNPTRDILVLLALGLVLDREQLVKLVEVANELLQSAGYLPFLRLPRLTDYELNAVSKESILRDVVTEDIDEDNSHAEQPVSLQK